MDVRLIFVKRSPFYFRFFNAIYLCLISVHHAPEVTNHKNFADNISSWNEICHFFK
jgi:hypothetical protein